MTDVGIWSDDYVLRQPTEAKYYLPWNFHDSNRAYWRPGSDLLMATLARVAGKSTWPFLVFSLATHACLVWLIYLFAQRMGARSWGACLSAAFFLTSSVHQEAVLWTAASVMTPALILMLLSVWAHTSLGTPTRRRSLLALLAAGASLLFRESGYVMPLLFVASTVLLWPRRTWRSGVGTAATVLVACCCHYLFLNRVVGGHIGLNPISVMGPRGTVKTGQ